MSDRWTLLMVAVNHGVVGKAGKAFSNHPAHYERVDVVRADEIERLREERDNWIETARQHLRNKEFYRGLVNQIAVPFGMAAYVSDDGSVREDVLALKVPELVARLREERDAIRAQNGQLADAVDRLQDDVANRTSERVRELMAERYALRAEVLRLRWERDALKENRDYWMEACQQAQTHRDGANAQLVIAESEVERLRMPESVKEGKDE